MTVALRPMLLRCLVVWAILSLGWLADTAGQSFETLYSFAATDPDLRAQGWTGALVRSGRAFFGVARYGGSSSLGSVFRIHPDHGVQILRSFSGPDGAYPGLLFAGRDGNLYGLTHGFAPWGGPVNCGSAFRIAPDLSVSILHVFGSYQAGEPCLPIHLLQASDGNLYGTTFGAYNPSMRDTVFRITPGVSLTTLVRVSHWEPWDLVEGNDGHLYGVTGQGGSLPCAYSSFGCGTIFRVSLAAPACPAEAICPPTILNTPNTPDGMAPSRIVKGLDGNFYGATRASEPCPTPGTCGGGTVFRVTPSGVLTTLHTFKPSGQRAQWLIHRSDVALYGGANAVTGVPGSLFKITPSTGFTELQPYYASLVSRSDDFLYGVMSNASWPYGAVFSMTAEGTIAPLHVFTSSDGAYPGPLSIGSDRALYGATSAGGAAGRGTAFRFDPEPWEDVALDFGPALGIWRLFNGVLWQQVHSLDPEAIVTGDLDGNDVDDLVIDFGSGIGVYAWMNHATWVPLHAFSPARMLTGDLDDSGRDDVVFDFPGFGLWIWSNHTTWVPLHGLSARHLAVGNLDGIAGEDLVVDFAGFGLYIFMNSSSWTLLHPLNAATILAADLDGSGQDDLVVDFPGAGLWVLANNAVWLRLHGVNATRVAAGDIDGSGQTDLVIDFGPAYGLWTFRNNTTWVALHGLSAEDFVLADRDGNGTDEVLVDFGPAYGLWQYANDAGWSQLHGMSPEGLAAGRIH